MKKTKQNWRCAACNFIDEHHCFTVKFKYSVCPKCESELGNALDKYNLEVNYNKNNGVWHCWACNQHGSLFTLIRKYGSKAFLDLFKNLEYGLLKTEEKEELPLELPKYSINVLNIPAAANYLLNDRKIPKQKIKERNVKYCYNGEYKDCIIFPSYDIENKLNGFVSHNLK